MDNKFFPHFKNQQSDNIQSLPVQENIQADQESKKSQLMKGSLGMLGLGALADMASSASDLTQTLMRRTTEKKKTADEAGQNLENAALASQAQQTAAENQQPQPEGMKVPEAEQERMTEEARKRKEQQEKLATIQAKNAARAASGKKSVTKSLLEGSVLSIFPEASFVDQYFFKKFFK